MSLSSIQSTSLSNPGILSKGKKLNDHVDDFIPDKKSTIVLGMYALVSKVNNISWNCFKDIQNVCGDDRLTTDEINDKLIVAVTMTWVAVLAFSVLSETPLFSVVLLVAFKTHELVVFMPDEMVLVLLLKTYPSLHFSQVVYCEVTHELQLPTCQLAAFTFK